MRLWYHSKYNINYYIDINTNEGCPIFEVYREQTPGIKVFIFSTSDVNVLAKFSAFQVVDTSNDIQKEFPFPPSVMQELLDDLSKFQKNAILDATHFYEHSTYHAYFFKILKYLISENIIRCTWKCPICETSFDLWEQDGHLITICKECGIEVYLPEQKENIELFQSVDVDKIIKTFRDKFELRKV